MLLIKNGRVIDPKTKTNALLDLLIDDGKIIKIEEHIEDENADIIDATNLIVAPGLIDNHVHFRDPGFTHKETLETGANAAKAGGFTTVVCMGNTKPCVDNVEVLEDIQERAKYLPIHVLQAANVTLGMKGKELTDMVALKEAGTIGFTDDGVPIRDPNVMLEAMRVAKSLDMPISLHEEDPALVGTAGVNAGPIADSLHIAGASHLAEETITARDCLLAKETGCRIDIQHLSSGTSVDIIRFMKNLGVDVWTEVTPQHLTLTEEDVLTYGANAKINPPLRSETDRMKLIEGLVDGTIDMIVTDHAPHAKEEKDKGIVHGAPSGMIGLETSLALTLTALVEPGFMKVEDVSSTIWIREQSQLVRMRIYVFLMKMNNGQSKKKIFIQRVTIHHSLVEVSRAVFAIQFVVVRLSTSIIKKSQKRLFYIQETVYNILVSTYNNLIRWEEEYV